MKDPIELTDSDAVISFGVPPERIDILTSITAVNFEAAWNNRRTAEYEGLFTPVIHWRDYDRQQTSNGPTEGCRRRRMA